MAAFAVTAIEHDGEVLPMCPVRSVAHVSGRSLNKIEPLERSLAAARCFPERFPGADRAADEMLIVPPSRR